MVDAITTVQTPLVHISVLAIQPLNYKLTGKRADVSKTYFKFFLMFCEAFVTDQAYFPLNQRHGAQF